jgi:hypothetical protein
MGSGLSSTSAGGAGFYLGPADPYNIGLSSSVDGVNMGVLGAKGSNGETRWAGLQWHCMCHRLSLFPPSTCHCLITTWVDHFRHLEPTTTSTTITTCHHHYFTNIRYFSFNHHYLPLLVPIISHFCSSGEEGGSRGKRTPLVAAELFSQAGR